MNISKLVIPGSAFLLFAVKLVLPVQSQSIRTPGEASGYKRYTQHDEVGKFLTEVDRISPEAACRAIGKTLDTKELPAANLHLCVLAEEGADNPSRLNRKKATVLVFASQHGNEHSGKEAALLLIRNLAVGDLKPLLRDLNVLVIPQSNPYGNYVNRRPNEQNLDLNRDHVKLEAPETRIIHSVFSAWMPEVTLDVHEKGDDYYRVSTGCVSNLNIHESLQAYSRERIFPEIEKSVAADGYTWHEYLVTDTLGSASAAGVPDRPGDRPARETLLRFSTTDLNDGRNGLGVYETLSFIQEGASRHDLETLEARTLWQYSGIRALLRFSAKHGLEMRNLVRGRRAELRKQARKPSAASVVHLRMEYVRDPNEPQLTLKRFERATSSDRNAAMEAKVVTEAVRNWFPKVEARLTVPRALGYVIPASHPEVVKTLLDHNIRVGVIAKETTLDLQTYRVKEIVPAKDDYVAPERMEVDKERNRTKLRPGDYFVSCDQPAANLIPSLLEPQSEYGLIRYRSYGLMPGKGSAYAVCRVLGGRRPAVTALIKWEASPLSEKREK